MKRLNYLLMLGVFSFLSFSLVSCDDDEESEPDNSITQEMLNGATVMQRELTGDEIQDFPHGGTGLSSDETIRVVYTNFDDITKTAVEDDIIVKHTYEKDANGEKGDLLVNYAMRKREAGYNSDGGDWEWIQMPNNAGNDFSANPNGSVADAANIGKLDGCIGCHSGSTDDFRFVVSK